MGACLCFLEASLPVAGRWYSTLDRTIVTFPVRAFVCSLLAFTLSAPSPAASNPYGSQRNLHCPRGGLPPRHRSSSAHVPYPTGEHDIQTVKSLDSELLQLGWDLALFPKCLPQNRRGPGSGLL